MVRRKSEPLLESVQRLFSEGTMTGASESQLLERFLSQRDEVAFEAIVHKHGPMVLAVCRRILSDPNDVDDAFQATFLILVKRAASIRDKAVLGTWLHGVARRVAVRAQVNSRRRRNRERGVAEIAAWEDRRPGDSDRNELRAIIDQEVARLTAKHRSALVLCDLEGQTHEQAAVQLRCPVGTVKSRLARAREALRSRLVRRGFAPSAVMLAASLAPEPASAVTSEMASTTIGTAIKLLASRGMVAGTVSAAVAALMEQTLKGLSMNALKLVIILAAAGLIVTSAGTFAYQTAAKKTPDTATGPQQKAYGKAYVPRGEATKAWLKSGQAPEIPGSSVEPKANEKAHKRPGSDPNSQALLPRLESAIPMKFPKPTPLAEVLKYIQQTIPGPDGNPIPIYVDPIAMNGENISEQIMKTPITMDLEGVPLRTTLKLIAEQLSMGCGIKDGMIVMRPPDMRTRNWHELMVMEESFPESSPLAVEVERARRGELTADELEKLDEQLKAIEEVTKRYQSIRMMRMGMPGAMMMQRMQSPPAATAKAIQ